MEITVAMRAHRKLRHCPSYRTLPESTMPRAADRSIPPLSGDESPIGYYENIPGSSDRILLVTDRALHMRGESGWITLPYETMIDVRTERGLKTADNLEIRLRDGSKALVPVLGEDGMGKDTYAMLMFLQHVIGDRERRAQADEFGTFQPDPPVPEERAAR